MKHMCLVVSLLAMAAGSLYASPTLACTGMTGVSGLGAVGSNGCFTTNFANVTSLDSLNWGAPSSLTGQSGLGSATPGYNSFSATSTPVANRTALSNGDPVSVSLPGGANTAVTRVDDLAYVWEGSTTEWSSAAYANVANFPGHFNSAGSTTAPPGDALLKDSSGTPLELSLLGATGPVLGIWFEIASLSGTNSTFQADVQAYDGSVSLGTYILTETANGTGGVCPGLTINTETPTVPVPCDDAPYVGFYDPGGRITSVYISVYNVGSPTVPIGFAIDSLYVDEAAVVPEPAIPLLIGTGLAAMALYRRKRHARVG